METPLEFEIVEDLTLTRNDLHQLYTEHVMLMKEKKIREYVMFIRERILLYNHNGDKQYCYTFIKKEEPEMVDEIVKRLQDMFIDSEIIVNNNDRHDSFVVRWNL